MEDKILINNQLQSFGNPMQNLIGTMRGLISLIGVAENVEALAELDKASKSINAALDIVNKNVWSV